MNDTSLPLASLSTAEEEEIEHLYEERADHLSLEAFKENTVLAAGSEEWVKSLTASGAKLLIGPRGCGKTHLMRYAYSQCIENKKLPFAIYANFNRYYRLEPLLRRRPDAISMFYTWVLSNTLIGLFNAIAETSTNDLTELDGEALLGNSRVEVEDIIGTLERAKALSEEQEALAASLTVDRIKNLIMRITDIFDRKRAVLLMDDAALTLAPEFMAHFFDIFRALKATRIAPKASVYPATTEYGPTFHVDHEAERIFVWKSVTDGNYQSFMQDIAEKRFPDVLRIQEEIRALLAYAAFGVPRSYMALVRSYNKAQIASRSSSASRQRWFNTVIEDFVGEKLKEYNSLAKKTPLLTSIIRVGGNCFSRIVTEVVEESQSLVDSSCRQIFIGISVDSIQNEYISRMFGLLEEAGLLYRYPKVSHGADRTYERFVPHLAALLEQRAFSRKGAFSPKLAIEVLQRPDEKHPVRRSVTTLIDPAVIASLTLDLPPCEACGAGRVESAKYCHNCGAPLTHVSTYERCMRTPWSEVPGLTPWQREKLSSASDLPKTIGEFLVLQDRGTALRTIRNIGSKRAKTVIEIVETFVDEFLS